MSSVALAAQRMPSLRPADRRVRPLRVAGTATDRTAVLTVTDALDRLEPATVGAGIEVVLERLDAVLSARPGVVIANLRHVDPSRFVVGLLSIMRRRAARAGAVLVLVGLSVALREQLDDARVSALYTTFPSVSHALLALGSPPLQGGAAGPGSSDLLG